MRVVFDSSVWIAAIGSKTGFASAAILYSYESADIEIFISHHIVDEVTSNLIKKLKFDEASALKAQTIITNLCNFQLHITPNEEQAIREIKYEKDRHILALCKRIKADFLVTFDRKHLLPLKHFHKTHIVEPKDFIEIIQKGC